MVAPKRASEIITYSDLDLPDVRRCSNLAACPAPPPEPEPSVELSELFLLDCEAGKSEGRIEDTGDAATLCKQTMEAIQKCDSHAVESSKVAEPPDFCNLSSDLLEKFEVSFGSF